MTREELVSYIQNSLLVGRVADADAVQLSGFECTEDEEFKRKEIEGSVEFNGMYFKITDDGKVILEYYAADYKYLDFGDSVDEISDCAFWYNKTIEELVAPSVKKIGDGAFRDCTLRHADFASVTEVGSYCFAYSGIETLQVPMLEVLHDFVFVGCCKLTELNLPNVKQMGNCSYAFGLEKFYAPKLDILGKSFFRECISLQEIYTPNVWMVERGAFCRCYAVMNGGNITLRSDAYIEPSALEDVIEYK